MHHPSIRNEIVSISLETGWSYIETENYQLFGKLVAAENSGTKFNHRKKDH
jgi:hypothetical protein